METDEKSVEANGKPVETTENQWETGKVMKDICWNLCQQQTNYRLNSSTMDIELE